MQPLDLVKLKGWQGYTFELDGSRIVNVFYGHEDDKFRQPSIIIGLSNMEKPELRNSTIFTNQEMPGNCILGIEVHNSGDVIGWKGSDPWKQDTKLATWLEKGAYPGTISASSTVMEMCTSCMGTMCCTDLWMLGETHKRIETDYSSTFTKRVPKQTNRLALHRKCNTRPGIIQQSRRKTKS